MIKDWSKLVNLLPKEIKVDEFNRPLERGIDIDDIIECMKDEYGFTVNGIEHSLVETMDENGYSTGYETAYNMWELHFSNNKIGHDFESIKIYMYGENLYDLGVYDIDYNYILDLGNHHIRMVSDTIYKPIEVFTPTYIY